MELSISIPFISDGDPHVLFEQITGCLQSSSMNTEYIDDVYPFYNGEDYKAQVQ